jgi:hypothetical protein
LIEQQLTEVFKRIKKNTIKPKGLFPLWSFRWEGRNNTWNKTWRTNTEHMDCNVEEKRGIK